MLMDGDDVLLYFISISLLFFVLIIFFVHLFYPYYVFVLVFIFCRGFRQFICIVCVSLIDVLFLFVWLLFFCTVTHSSARACIVSFVLLFLYFQKVASFLFIVCKICFGESFIGHGAHGTHISYRNSFVDIVFIARNSFH